MKTIFIACVAVAILTEIVDLTSVKQNQIPSNKQQPQTSSSNKKQPISVNSKQTKVGQGRPSKQLQGPPKPQGLPRPNHGLMKSEQMQFIDNETLAYEDAENATSKFHIGRFGRYGGYGYRGGGYRPTYYGGRVGNGGSYRRPSVSYPIFYPYYIGNFTSSSASRGPPGPPGPPGPAGPPGRR